VAPRRQQAAARAFRVQQKLPTFALINKVKIVALAATTRLLPCVDHPMC
jgi:hypothetical protein